MLLELTSCWADTQIQETLTARRRPPSARPNTFLPSSVQGSGVEFSVDSQQQSCSTHVQEAIDIAHLTQATWLHTCIRSVPCKFGFILQHQHNTVLSDRNKYPKL